MSVPLYLTIRDRLMPGPARDALVVQIPAVDRITLRDILAARVRREVDAHNQRIRSARDEPDAPYSGMLPIDRSKGTREADFEPQLHAACDAFERNAFFVLVGDRQVTTLDEPIDVVAQPTVTFIKLVPLVGG
jgi:hypothetical protein